MSLEATLPAHISAFEKTDCRKSDETDGGGFGYGRCAKITSDLRRGGSVGACDLIVQFAPWVLNALSINV